MDVDLKKKLGAEAMAMFCFVESEIIISKKLKSEANSVSFWKIIEIRSIKKYI